VNRFGVGSPIALRREPSVPPRISECFGSMPSARIACSAALTLWGKRSMNRRMFGYCGVTSTSRRVPGAPATTSSAVRLSSSVWARSFSSSKSRVIARSLALPAPPEIS
jgi:hypothetical protein